MYLIGNSNDSIEDGMYPLTIIKNLKKEDLLRCKRDDIIIINLEDKKYFDPNKNSWMEIKQYQEYTDQWKSKND